MNNVEEAAAKLKTLTKRPTNEEFLSLYGLYKQASVGDNPTPKPGMFDMKGQFKWKAWSDRAGMGQAQAAADYVALADSLLAKYADQ